MLAKLLLLFVTVPLIELALLLYLADRTSWPLALALVLIPGFTGAWLVRSQGWRTWSRIQQELAAGHLPTDALLDGALIFVAGALLLTPGVLTDLVAITLLLPPTRRLWRRGLAAWFGARFHVQVGRDAPPRRSEVIDSYVVEPPREEP
jgi:UPF0716 protein FxsA